MLSRLQLPKSSIWPQWFPGEVGCCLTTARPSPVVGAALRATPGLERDDRSTPTNRGIRTTAAAAAPPDWKSDQPELAFNCRYLISNIAINAAQTCVFRALAEVPMKVFTRRFCFKALKNSSICQRCLYTSATVAAAKVR